MNDLRFPTDKYFYDTCSLLLAGEQLFEKSEPFYISSITLKELERIKTASNKDADIKYAARFLLHNLESHPDRYEVVLHKTEYEKPILKAGFEVTDDTRILADAIHLDRKEDIVFVTNDLSLKHIANIFFGDGMIESIAEDNDFYAGYKEVICNDELLATFYQDTTQNHFESLIGEYIIIKNKDHEIVDMRVWTGEDYRYLSSKPINSKWFGKISPFDDDIYQKMLFDSLRNNKITMVKGPAGSGKSFISLAYLMGELEQHHIDKILIFCNTVATADSAKLGFYPGSRLEKLLDSQIGNFLVGKFGGMEGVQQLINDGKLELLPLSDIRGFDTGDLRIGVYITEAQNLSKSLMKLALQRIGENSIAIIDGDNRQQVDLKAYEGSNNGMRALSKAFRGESIYGEVTLQKIHRSRIAQLAERII